jgi:hypothetical protein
MVAAEHAASAPVSDTVSGRRFKAAEEDRIAMRITLRSLEAGLSTLRELGFRRVGQTHCYRLDGLSMSQHRQWCVLDTPMPSGPCDLLEDQWGKPGLWKLTRTKSPQVLRRQFHLPLAVLQPDDGSLGDSEPTDTLRDCIEWALVTSRGEPSSGWVPPRREEVEAWIPEKGLIVQSGPFVRQGRLVYEPDRLAIQFPIVSELPPALAEARVRMLREVLIDAQNRWRLVRMGLSVASERQAVEAEVDLSGAPLAVLESLFRISLDALRWVVQWLIWSAMLLADPRVECRSWEIYECGHGPRKGDVES